MRNFKVIVLLALTMFLLMGCSQVKDRFALEDIDSIIIQTGIEQKEVVEGEVIKKLMDFLNILELKNQDETNFKGEESYRVLLMEKLEITEEKADFKEDEVKEEKKEELVGYISFIGSKIYYKNNWYDLDEDTFIEFKNIYDGLNAPVETKEELKVIEEKRKIREFNTEGDSLQGIWVFQDGTEIEFKENILTQGDYSFRYSIEKKENDTIHLSVYGLKGLNIKGKKLFDLYITMDDTKCNAKMEKVIPQLGSRDLIFEYNMVFVDNEGVVLGAFDDGFFIK